MPYSDPAKRRAYEIKRNERRNANPEAKARAALLAKEARKRNPRAARNRQLKCQFGITIDQFEQMVVEQDNRCAICSKEFLTTPHVDHDHVTLRVRKLLCLACNTGLGNFRDSTELLQKASEYLMEFKDA